MQITALQLHREFECLRCTRLVFEWRPCKAREESEAPTISNARQICSHPTFSSLRKNQKQKLRSLDQNEKRNIVIPSSIFSRAFCRTLRALITPILHGISQAQISIKKRDKVSNFYSLLNLTRAEVAVCLLKEKSWSGLSKFQQLVRKRRRELGFKQFSGTCKTVSLCCSFMFVCFLTKKTDFFLANSFPFYQL